MKTKDHNKHYDTAFLNEISLTITRGELHQIEFDLEKVEDAKAKVIANIRRSARGVANDKQAVMLTKLDEKATRLTSKREELLNEYMVSENLITNNNRNVSKESRENDSETTVPKQGRDESERQKAEIEKIRDRQKGRDEERER